MRSGKLLILAITALLFLQTIKPYDAVRVLDEEEEQWMKKEQNLLLPSFRGGPPSPNGCTWIPGSGGTPCTASISERNFAAIAPKATDNGAYPKQMVPFGVATAQRN